MNIGNTMENKREMTLQEIEDELGITLNLLPSDIDAIQKAKQDIAFDYLYKQMMDSLIGKLEDITPLSPISDNSMKDARDKWMANGGVTGVCGTDQWIRTSGTKDLQEVAFGDGWDAAIQFINDHLINNTNG